jgi:tRNA pseudouridine synthase 10
LDATPDAITDAALPRILAVTAELDFSTYLVGTRLPRAFDGTEDDGEQFRLRTRGAMLARLETLWPQRRRVASCADVRVMLDPDRPSRVMVQVAPMFVAGRYRKLARGISQTVFVCRECRGGPRSCAACGWTGRVVGSSVEEFVCPAITASAGGVGASFHGAGREDVDVRMLGAGRPFVVSVRKPKRRAVDAAAVARAVVEASAGRVEVAELRVVDRETMRRLTTEHGTKTYRATVDTQSALPADAAARVASLAGTEIRQRTPERVGRRADLVRVRRVHAVEVESVAGGRLVATILTDPGTYVKELVSGDDGRTEPSFASVLGQPCVCAELDVVYAGAAAESA